MSVILLALVVLFLGWGVRGYAAGLADSWGEIWAHDTYCVCGTPACRACKRKAGG